LAAATGVHLLFTRFAFGTTRLVSRRGLHAVPRSLLTSRATRALERAGLRGTGGRELAAVMVVIAAVAGGGALVLFDGLLPAIVIALFAATMPVAAHRQRERASRQAAQDGWPRLIDEIRILTGSVGHSIPQALFEAGANAPAELRVGFHAAHREWRLSTDFGRTLSVLKHHLHDPTADAACETLLIAHELGGRDLDRRLDDLAADRRAETQFRKDARARQAGVRFARRFVLLVPLGMAVAGLSVGNGRQAYGTPLGQTLVVVALIMVVACWIWAGAYLRLPESDRVFDS
jgi:tight adherence protein B